MKKYGFPLLLLAMALQARAQERPVRLCLSAEGGIPVNGYRPGWGVLLQGSRPAGRSALFTLTAGISRFSSKGVAFPGKSITRLIPVLAGYRQHFQQFYLEPQAGYGELGGTVSINGDQARPSVGAFFWAVGGGYRFQRLVFGFRHQAARGVGGAAAGLWHDRSFHYTAISIGYRIL